MLPAFGLAGSYSAGGFKTKAEALHFAIVFTATSTESGNEFNEGKAQTLFDFITSNVQLPDVDYSQAQVDELFSATNGILKGIALGLKKIEGDTPEETPEPCDSPDGPPARPETELSQDRFTFDPRITPVGV
jgi:hypothetical protein